MRSGAGRLRWLVGGPGCFDQRGLSSVRLARFKTRRPSVLRIFFSRCSDCRTLIGRGTCDSMRPISAADAITPAFRRMGDLLWRPFRFGTFMKVSFVAMVAEMGCISFAVQMPLQALMVVGQAL